MMTNPLKQYFRRPALFLILPSQGKFYPKDALEMTETGELPVFPMTAIDEVTSKTPDALFNGSAMIDIIKSCVPNIKDPWQIPSIDIDPIMIAIRSATSGNDMDIESTCSSCNATTNYKINLVGLLNNIESGDYDQEFDVGELSIKYKPLKYKTINESTMRQFEIQMQINKISEMTDENEKLKQSGDLMKKLNLSSFKLVSENIDQIKFNNEVVNNKDYIQEFLTNTDKNTYDKIREHGVNLRKKSEIKPMHIKCANCGHEYDQALALNISDFFG